MIGGLVLIHSPSSSSSFVYTCQRIIIDRLACFVRIMPSKIGMISLLLSVNTVCGKYVEKM